MTSVRCLATFDITSMVVLFERTCRKHGIAAKVIPVPRKLSTSCGLACEFPCESNETVKELCTLKHIDVSSYHQMEDDWT